MSGLADEARVTPGALAPRVSRLATRVLVPLIAVGLGLAVGAIVIVLTGGSPIEAYGQLLRGAVGTQSNLNATLARAVPIVIVGVGLAIAFRTGALNLGGEGQMIMAAVATAVAANQMGGWPMPWRSWSPSPWVASAGALWALGPTWLQARFEVPLLITTLLLNYVAALLAAYLVSYPLREAGGGVAQTPMIPDATQLPYLAPGGRLHAGVLLLLILPLAAWWLQRRTVVGYEMRMTGFNAAFSEYGGVERPADAVSRDAHLGCRVRPGRGHHRAGRHPSLHRYHHHRAGLRLDGLHGRAAGGRRPAGHARRGPVPVGSRRGGGGHGAQHRHPHPGRGRRPGLHHPDGRLPADARPLGRPPTGCRLMDGIGTIVDVALLASMVRLVSPILLAALGGLLTERAGIFNVALEGLMLSGAFAAVVATSRTGDPLIGVGAAVVAAVVVSVVFGVVVIDLKGDAIVAGLAINLLALGATTFLMRAIFGVQGGFYDPTMPGLAPIDIPFLSGHPVVGAIVSGQTALVWVAVGMVGRAPGAVCSTTGSGCACGPSARTSSRPAAWASGSGASSTRRCSAVALCAGSPARSCRWAS